MAIVSILCNCGCGTKVRTVEEAIKHADDHGHTLTVQGMVEPSERRVKARKTYVQEKPRARTSKAFPATPAEIVEQDKIDFGSLRARLQKKT